MTSEIEHKLKLRHLTHEDYEAIRDISGRVYKGVAPPWSQITFNRLIDTFPDGLVYNFIGPV